MKSRMTLGDVESEAIAWLLIENGSGHRSYRK